MQLLVVPLVLGACGESAPASSSPAPDDAATDGTGPGDDDDPASETSAETSGGPDSDPAGTGNEPTGGDGGTTQGQDCPPEEWTCPAGCCSWSNEVVDAEGFPGRLSDLVIAEDGVVHIAYRQEEEDDWFAGLSLASGNLGGWTKHEVTFPAADAAYGVSVAVVDSTPWLAEAGGSPAMDQPDTVRVGTLAGGMNLLAQTEPHDEEGARTAMAVDSSGALQICYVDPPEGATCVVRSGNAFTTVAEFSSPSEFGYEAISPRIVDFALDADDRWHAVYSLAFEDAGFLIDQPGLFYRTAASGAESLDVSGDVDDVELRVDAQGRPHVAFIAGGDVHYAVRDGSWSTEVVHPSASTVALALDSQGRPAIAFYDQADDTMRFAYRLDAQWRIDAPDDAPRAGLQPAMVFDDDDVPHVSYFDESLRVLKYATWQ